MGNKTGASTSTDGEGIGYSSAMGNLHCRYITSSGAVEEWSLITFDLTVNHDKHSRHWEMVGSALSNRRHSYNMRLTYEELTHNITINLNNYEFTVKPSEAAVMYFPSKLSLEIKFLKNIEGKKGVDHYTIKGGSSLKITHWFSP
jgi:hypothetical protein